MGRTIPSFRIAAILEEKEWKMFRKYLNKKDKKAFDEMFSIARLYNSACSYSVIPIRIYPIMMSIVFHHYKILKDHAGLDIPYFSEEEDINYNSTILKGELDKWYSFSSILRKPNRDLFNQMLNRYTNIQIQ